MKTLYPVDDIGWLLKDLKEKHEIGKSILKKDVGNFFSKDKEPLIEYFAESIKSSDTPNKTYMDFYVKISKYEKNREWGIWYRLSKTESKLILEEGRRTQRSFLSIEGRTLDGLLDLKDETLANREHIKNLLKSSGIELTYNVRRELLNAYSGNPDKFKKAIKEKKDEILNLLENSKVRRFGGREDFIRNYYKWKRNASDITDKDYLFLKKSFIPNIPDKVIGLNDPWIRIYIDRIQLDNNIEEGHVIDIKELSGTNLLQYTKFFLTHIREEEDQRILYGIQFYPKTKYLHVLPIFVIYRGKNAGAIVSGRTPQNIDKILTKYPNGQPANLPVGKNKPNL